jgi:hypothetical protein
VAKLTKEEKDRFKSEQAARRARYKKPSRGKIKSDAAAAEKSRQWVLARVNLPVGDAKDVLGCRS